MGTLALVPAGAGVWVFRYGGYVRLWLGCQDPLAGLWGIQWLRREVTQAKEVVTWIKVTQVEMCLKDIQEIKAMVL